MRGAQPVRHVHPLLDVVQHAGAPRFVRLHHARAAPRAGKRHTVLEGHVAQARQVGRIGRLQVVGRQVNALEAKLGAL